MFSILDYNFRSNQNIKENGSDKGNRGQKGKINKLKKINRTYFNNKIITFGVSHAL